MEELIHIGHFEVCSICLDTTMYVFFNYWNEFDYYILQMPYSIYIGDFYSKYKQTEWM